MYLFPELKLRHLNKKPLQSEMKTIKICNFGPNLAVSRFPACIFWFRRVFIGFGGFFANLNTLHATF